MVFTIEQLVFMVEEYVRSASFAKCRIKFAERFPEISKVPNKSTIHRTVQRFRQTGSVLKKKRASESSVLTKGTLTVVKQFMSQSPRVSIKDLSKQCGLNRETCRRALIQLRTESDSIETENTEPEKLDKNKRLNYCMFFNENFLGDPNISDLTFFSGKATFNLAGEVRSLNTHIPPWFPDNQQQTNQYPPPMNHLKIGVWCAISRRRVIGPIFYEEELNYSHYLDILKQFVDELHDDELQYGYFQQDETSYHTHSAPMKLLEQYFGDRVISKGIWPSQSSDLTSIEYFLWGYVRAKCYENNPQTFPALKSNIAHVIYDIPVSILCNLANNNNLRVQACLQAGGEQFQHLM